MGRVCVKIANPFKTSHFLLLVILVSLIPPFSLTQGIAYSGSYHYQFIVDEDGFTSVAINFTSSQKDGSSWVFVPKFSNWINVTLSGRILEFELVETEHVVDERYYFYQVFKFSFKSNESFRMSLQFNMSVGALIIEPHGIFFSPQIGFQEDSDGEAEVFLPNSDTVTEAVAIGRTGNYQPTERRLNYVLFDLPENLIRLQIGFKTSIAMPELLTLKRDIFTFQAVKRYESYASNILNLFSTVCDSFVDLFNVTLEGVDIRFFIPEFYTLLSIGGYVPFTGGGMGDININVFFIRSVEGIIEVIALHELVHHFLYKAGLSPSNFLWFHEGMAQYINIEIADGLGYEGASSERAKLEEGVSQIIQRGENFYFLQQWKPETQPANIAACYIASYYVVSRLAQEYGGLDYYRRFFKLIKGIEVKDNGILAYYLSLAANTSVAPTLRRWGFDIVDLYVSSTLIDETERAVYGLNPLFQPYKFLAEHLYKQALISLEKGDIEKTNQYLETAIFMAKLAPILTIITAAAILLAIIYIFKRHSASPKPSDLNFSDLHTRDKS